METTEIEKVAKFINEFSNTSPNHLLMVEASTVNKGILELSGMVDSYFGGDNITGDPLLAGWILCMENRKLLSIVQTGNKKFVSFKLANSLRQ